MGILNLTPDSFSDGGRYVDPQTALAHASRMVAEGADILDVGAEFDPALWRHRGQLEAEERARLAPACPAWSGLACRSRSTP